MNQKNIIIFSSIALITSLFVFAWYRDWIIIALPSGTLIHPIATHAITKKKVALFFRKKTGLISKKPECEYKELLWTDIPEKNIMTLLQAWASCIDEEDLLQKKITVQTASIVLKTNELIISWDRPPFNKQDAGFKKYLFLETLLMTLAKEFPHIQTVRFLVHHQPMQDEHLDFSQPWPLNTLPLQNHEKNNTPLPFNERNKTSLTLVIDPSGDAHHTGRIIDDVFERSITLRCAQELKKRIEESNPYINVYLTRFSGETIEPLQNAIFANRLGADLYINLHCYQETSNTPHLSLTTFLYETDSQFAPKKSSNLSLVPLHQAYRDYAQQTTCVVQRLHALLNSHEAKNRYALEPVRSFPYKPLLGIHTVALGIEVGLPKKDDWIFLMQVLTNAVQKLLKP